jgi:phosphoglycolate phosphatase-like HAD superfamily hydrolase
MQKLKTVILDVDGTLIDSNEGHVMAWQDALTEFGFRVSDDDIRRGIGMGGDHLLPALIQLNSESEKGQRLSALRGELFRKNYLPQLRAFPKVRELLLKFLEAGFDLVVATSAEKKDLKLLLEQAGVPSVALTCGGWDSEALNGAVEVYADAADLLRQFDDSIFRRPRD